MPLQILALFSCLLVTGCWDRIEVNDLAIILATGVDTRDNQVELTAQIFIPRKAGSGSSSGTGSGEASQSGVTMIRTAVGSNVAEAMNRLQRKVSRNVFWGHCEVIVISEQASKQGLRQYLDFFLRYTQIREHAFVFSTSKKARDLLALLPPLERSSAESLREMSNLKLGTRVTVLNLAQSIEGPSRSAVLSRMLILKPTSGQSIYASDPYVRGLTLIKNDRYVKTVTEPMSVGVLMLLNQLNNIIMPVDIEGKEGAVSIRLSAMKTKLTPQISNNEWSMKIKVDAKGEVVLNTTSKSIADPHMNALIEQQWKKKLTGLAEDALKLSQKQLKTDFFGFSIQFRRHYPKQWKSHKQNWDEILENMKVEVRVNTLITSTGKSTDPQGVPGQSDRY
ncbi:Ger(x)C family spore germination protein [Paenibacillus cellulosilyticus]|uniref:Ger(x)C family spore germination protein n=1 Tax=Paenibacillus cellulosilyticus TaxID=375489 RepID=UPI00157FD211|nr:Ger(x)C family spore germination protein [Paenibacillus cellulosilyticus]QKS45890.1 Ger(x)C family spore germination protein [Paenibacillus cellulosilyticus]